MTKEEVALKLFEETPDVVEFFVIFVAVLLLVVVVVVVNYIHFLMYQYLKYVNLMINQ
jgi:hypothetical protein